jgi:hypothetical protein
VLEAAQDPRPRWLEGELSSILRHQLSAPVWFDWANDGGRLGCSPVESSDGIDGPKIPRPSGATWSFRELFHHAKPPLPLLRQTHQFAKRNLESAVSLLPSEISAVLYYASIVVALDRCGERISSLDEESLRTAIAWVLARDWADEETKSVFRGGAHSELV